MLDPVVDDESEEDHKHVRMQEFACRSKSVPSTNVGGHDANDDIAQPEDVACEDVVHNDAPILLALQFLTTNSSNM